MGTKRFFDAADPHNLVKTQIVVEYFSAWAKIMLKNSSRGRDLGYVDLFSGPGEFKDGEASTPIHILQRVIASPELADRLRTLFNDGDAELSANLRRLIRDLPGVEDLRHQPVVESHEVAADVSRAIRLLGPIPTFFFIDPFGFKAISRSMIADALAGWGCDVLFFFNFNAINRAIGNPVQGIARLVDAIFGEERATRLRNEARWHDSRAREQLVVTYFVEALKEVGAQHVIDFPVESKSKTRTSHYLVLATKNPLGIKIMKDIMAKASTDKSSFKELGFTYERGHEARGQMSLFSPEYESTQRLVQLKALLQTTYAGRSVTVRTILYEMHSKTDYTEKNLKDALRSLAEDGAISAQENGEFQRRSGKILMGDDLLLAFN